MSVRLRISLLTFCFIAAFGFSSCAKEKFSCDTEQHRQAIVAEVDQLLSTQDCAGALDLIEAFYPKTECAFDDIRLARAAANSCAQRRPARYQGTPALAA